MKVTVLGNCSLIPNRNNACSSFLIQTEKSNILFDCGPGTLSKLTDYIKLDKLDAIVISHFDADNYSDLLCIKKAFDLYSDLLGWKPLTIYCPTPTKAIRQFIVSPYIHYEFYDKEDVNLEIEDLSLSFLETKHDDLTHSYMCKVTDKRNNSKIVLTGDIAGFNTATINFVSGSQCLICDCSILEEYQDEDSKHLSPTRAISLAEKSKVPMLMLTNFNTFIPFSEYITEMENAKPKIPTYIAKSKESYYF